MKIVTCVRVGMRDYLFLRTQIVSLNIYGMSDLLAFPHSPFFLFFRFSN